MAEVVVNKITEEVIEGYTTKDLSLIPAFETVSQFKPATDNVEFSFYTEQGTLEFINPNYTGYQVTLNYGDGIKVVSSVTVDPEKDLLKNGYDQGNYTVYYNFLRNVLSSSLSTPYFLDQVSSDRTELRIVNNSLSNDQLATTVSTFIEELNDSPYFEDFRINFGNNNIFIANNILLDTSNSEQYTVLVKLYEPLPPQIELKDALTVAFQTADEVSFKVSFENKVIPPPPPKKIKGPNFGLDLASRANVDTSYKTANDLLSNVALSSSYDQIQGILNQKGININVDYSDFNNFVYFSSAEQRVRNFYYKVSLIEGYNDEISNLDGLANSQVSSSLAILENKKRNIIKNFDGYEKYQYYSSGSSNIYPKTNSSEPYTLASTGSSAALAWLEDQAITSGSEYDIESVDRLANSLPNHVKDDTNNTSFLLFMDMIGQHFDNIWAYTKDVSNRFDGDNRLAYGISKDLVKDALVSMGVNVLGNNQSDFDIYSGLTSVGKDGTTGLPSGSEEINTETIDIADPKPKEDIVKGVYKRIFHNLPYLLKKKGSYQGLRTLINAFGVPGGMLRIAEYGGWYEDSSKFKYYQQLDNLAATKGHLTINGINAKAGNPFSGALANVLFRFKYISGTLPPQGETLNVGNFGSALNLTYDGGGVTGSYSGSIVSSSLNVYKGNLSVGSAGITAPFFNGDWWTVALSSDGTNVLRVASNGHNSGDGFQPVYYLDDVASVGVSGNTGKLYGNGSSSGTGNNRSTFAFQEVRYYTDAISENMTKAYTMNPLFQGESNGDVITDVYNNLFFRAPLGTDNIELSQNQAYNSVHPRASGYSAGFKATSFTGGSTYNFGPLGPTVDMIPNKEFAYFNEPASGVKNRRSDKFRSVDNSSLITGTTLSSLSSIDQRKLDNNTFSSPDTDYVEVGFSPQNEINDDIAASYGDNLDIGEYIGDPRQFQPNYDGKYNSSYPDLMGEAEKYFQKYNGPYDLKDYTRLIKYFDNSLLKMVKEFIPAKASSATGIIIKQHLLERSRAKVVSGSLEDLTYSGSLSNTWKWNPNYDGTGSMMIPTHTPLGKIEAGAGGVFNAVNGLEYYISGGRFLPTNYLEGATKPYPPNAVTPTAFVSQSYLESIKTKSGSIEIIRDTQEEFYNGELSGSTVSITNGNLNVSTPQETNESFIAPYNVIFAYDNYSSFIGSSQGAYGGLIEWYWELSETEFAFRITNKDSGNSSRLDYLNSLSVGDKLFLRVTDSTYITGNVYEFTITSISSAVVGPVTKFTIYIDVADTIPGLGGDWYVRRTTNGFASGFELEMVYDDSQNEASNQSDNNNPIYNNVSRQRLSSVFMDVDYTSFGSGSLVPVNIGLIRSGSAVKAAVQDSNYTSTGYSNARYKGTKVSSLGFNIPYSKT